MAQSDVVRVAIAAAVGAFVAAVVAVAVFGGIFSGDTETRVTLWQMPDGSCSMGKETHVRVKQDKHVVWKIRNYCTSQAVVAVGNFRTQEQGGGSNCSAAGTANPFVGERPRTETVPAANVENGEIEYEKGEIKQKSKKLANEQQSELYYFDLCLNGVSVDPMLAVER